MISFRNIENMFRLGERGLSVIAASLFSSWLLAFTFQGQVLFAITRGHEADTSSLIFQTIAVHFAGLFICGFFIKNGKAAKQTMMISTILCIFGSLLFLLPCPGAWYPSLVIMSFSAGFFVACWGFFYKSCTPTDMRLKTAADVLIYSNIGMSILNFIALNLSPHAGLVIAVIMLIGALLLTSNLDITGRAGIQAPPTLGSGEVKPVKPLIYLYVFVLIITINSGLMYQVINPAFQHHVLLVSWYWAVPYVLALYLVRNLPLKVSRAYILYVAIAMIGFSFIFFMILDRSAISYLIINTLMLGACGVCDLFWWSILGEMLDYGNNTVKIFGIGLSANVLGVFIGDIIGNTINASSNQTYNPSVIALIVVFTILIILPLLNRQLSLVLKNHAFLARLYDMTNSKINNVDSGFMKSYDLTVREKEVAMLLLRGRTYKMIAGELYLSENTVKTHIKNIYSKLNINSKTELVKLLIEKEHALSNSQMI